MKDINIESKNVLYSVSFLILFFVGRIHEAFPFLMNLSVIKIGFIISILSLLFSGYQKNNFSQTCRAIPGKYLLLLYLFSALSVFGGVWPGASFDYVVQVLTTRCLFFFLIAITIITLQGLKTLHACLATVYSVLVLLALFVPRYVDGRTTVTISYDPNDLALILAMGLPILFFRYWVSNKAQHKFFFVVCFFLGCLVILKTGSRGGLLALIAGIIAIMVLQGIRKSFFPVIIAAGCFVVLTLPFVPVAQLERLGSIGNLDEDYNTDSRHGRVEIWKRGGLLMVDNPFFGTGAGTYQIAEGGVNQGGKWMTAHNCFIQIGVELGMPALLIFILMLYKVMSLLQRAKEAGVEEAAMAKGLQGSIVVYIVGGMFLSWAYAYMLYLIMAMAAVLLMYCQKKMDGERKAQISPDISLVPIEPKI
jgi:O-antigen ligase